MGMSKPVQVFRWLAVLPCAVLSAFLVMFPIHWVVMLIQALGKYGDDSLVTIDGRNPITVIPPEMLELLAYAFSTPLVIVYVGAKIAPTYKFQTGRIIAILWAILFVASLVFVISQGQYSGWGWLYFVISCILGIVGVSVGLFKVHKFSNSNIHSTILNRMIDKLKDLPLNLFTGIVLIVIVFACWVIIAWLYPDEWFAEIPKLILGLIGIDFS